MGTDPDSLRYDMISRSFDVDQLLLIHTYLEYPSSLWALHWSRLLVWARGISFFVAHSTPVLLAVGHLTTINDVELHDGGQPLYFVVVISFSHILYI